LLRRETYFAAFALVGDPKAGLLEEHLG